MLPKEYSEDKEAWKRKWRAKRKQIEEQEGQGAEDGDTVDEKADDR